MIVFSIKITFFLIRRLTESFTSCRGLFSSKSVEKKNTKNDIISKLKALLRCGFHYFKDLFFSKMITVIKTKSNTMCDL